MGAIAAQSLQAPLAPFPGGVLVRGRAGGAVVGAIGVSGASADEDEECAIAGVRALGADFVTEPAGAAEA